MSPGDAPTQTTLARPPPPWIYPAAGAFALLLVTCLAYATAIQSGYIWDDDMYVHENPLLTEPGGLPRIWKSITTQETPQYYPLVFTTYWLEHAVWGMNAHGYHAVNVVLHAISGLLVVWIVKQIGLPGAWLAGAIFALHPVHVESVAWITERKNVLSGLFYLLAMALYLRHEDTGKPSSYGAAFVLFLFALLSKTVTCSLPVALLLIRWFRKRPIDAAYGLKLIPFFAVGLVMGLFTARYESSSVGATGPDWDFSFADRLLIAGRALWFYPAKLLWPSSLTFIYPRWDIDAAQAAQWIPPIAAAVLAGALFALRNRIGRGPFTATAFTFATLFPALGFINVYPMRYSFVADHFQYLASIGFIVLFSVLAAKAFARFAVQAGPIPVVAGALLILPLAGLTFQQGKIYENTRTLWEDTLAKNPRACIAYVELGMLDLQAKDSAAARARFEKCLEVDPGFPEANTNVGNFLAQQGRFMPAIDHYKTALARKENDWLTLVTLTHALNKVHAYTEAETYARHAVEVVPTYGDAYRALAMAYQGQGRLPEAEATFRRAVEADPGFWRGWSGLGVVLMDQGKHAEAVDALRRARTIEPRSKNTRAKLAEALYCAGLQDEATRIDPQVAQRAACVAPAPDDSPSSPTQ